MTAARWDAAAKRWSVRTDRGDELRCRFYVMATGCLSIPIDPKIDGLSDFKGPVYRTSDWPHEGADLAGKRVGLLGTGSSGIQATPIFAA